VRGVDVEGTDVMFCLQRLISFRRMKTLNASIEDIAVAARGVDMLEVYPCSAHNHNASLHFRPQYIRSPMCIAHITTSNHICLRFLDPGLIQTDRVFFYWNLRGNKQVSEDGQKVRRLVPIPPEDEVLDRTIYAKPFKFNSVGKVGSVPGKFGNSRRCRMW